MKYPFQGKCSAAVKSLVVIGILWVLPILLMSLFTMEHLRTIQEVSYQGARAVLVSNQSQRMMDRLTMEATRLSNLFIRLQDEAYCLASFSESLLGTLPRVTYRNGSGYRVNRDGTYSTLGDDGNSALFANGYRPSMERAVVGTEALDLLLKPLSERESRMVLGWILHKEGFIRLYPWSDGKSWPRNKPLTTWPFYFLADEEHDPARIGLFTPVYLDPLSRQWMISCLCPVYSRDRHVATVGIDITVHKILKEISEITLSKGSSTFLLSDSEIIAASDNLPLRALGLDPALPSHGQVLERSRLPEVQRLAQVMRGAKQSVKPLKLQGYRAMAGFATVEPLGWKIVCLVPEAEFLAPSTETATEIFAESRKIRRNFIHILAFTFLGIVAITLLLFFHESRGIRRILRGIRILGDGELSHRLPEDSTEMGQLAGALNSMAASLQEKKHELQRVFAEMEQGRKLSAVGRLAAGVAHEVNNPLATISTYTQMVLRRDDIPPDVSDSMRIVMAEINRIQAKVRNLLDLTRLKSPDKEPVRPNVIVREIASLVCNETATRDIDLRLSLCKDDVTIYADSSGIKQVIWNLLRNALDAQGKGGTIKISSYLGSSSHSALSFIIEVEDEGPGIPDEALPHIFEPFFSSKEVGQGTGLGLSIVYNIVNNHGGSIEVTNLLSKGCVFKVTLPYQEEK